MKILHFIETWGFVWMLVLRKSLKDSGIYVYHHIWHWVTIFFANIMCYVFHIILRIIRYNFPLQQWRACCRYWRSVYRLGITLEMFAAVGLCAVSHRQQPEELLSSRIVSACLSYCDLSKTLWPASLLYPPPTEVDRRPTVTIPTRMSSNTNQKVCLFLWSRKSSIDRRFDFRTVVALSRLMESDAM